MTVIMVLLHEDGAFLSLLEYDTGHYPQSDESTPLHSTYVRSKVLSSHLYLGLQSGLLHSGFTPKPCMHSASIPCMPMSRPCQPF
jgi:hypothetical protein